MKFLATSIYVLLLFASCPTSETEPGPAPVSANYEEKIELWVDERIETLKQPTGWMRLAGTIPNQDSAFHLQNGTVEFSAADDVSITNNGKPFTDMEIFDGENAPFLKLGSLEWHVMQHRDLIAIRLYNSKTLDQAEDASDPGTLSSRFNDREYALQASQNHLFFITGDETNQTESYQAGRHMYVDFPDKSGRIIFDFNKINNPPCAYTVYSTCQLSPEQSRLYLLIAALEKRPVNRNGL